MSIVSPDDVLARWPIGVPPPPGNVIQTWLDDALAIIRATYGACLDDLTPDQEAIVRMVAARMVVRVLSNPRGVLREQVGDTSVFYSDASPQVMLTPDDAELLDGICGVASGSLVSIPLQREDREQMIWADLTGTDVLPEWWPWE